MYIKYINMYIGLTRVKPDDVCVCLTSAAPDRIVFCKLRVRGRLQA